MADTQKQTMVVEYVQPTPRSWTTADGVELRFVAVNFSDGSEGSLACTPGQVDDVKSSLQALVGQASEFELEPKPDYNGQKQWKIKGYPGKPSTGGGGGGGARGGGGGMSHAQAGYMAAASALGPLFYGIDKGTGEWPTVAFMVEQVTELGEALTQRLFDRKPPATETEAAAPSSDAPTGTTATAPPPSITLNQLKLIRELIEGKGWTTAQAAEKANVGSLTDLTEAQAAELLDLWA